MAACDCDMDKAFGVAERMAVGEGLQGRGTWGLLGVRLLLRALLYCCSNLSACLGALL